MQTVEHEAGCLEPSVGLKRAVESGIERRLDKVGDGTDSGRKKKGIEEEGAWEWLVESGERMLVVVRSVK
jgi:hypothetical protein